MSVDTHSTKINSQEIHQGTAYWLPPSGTDQERLALLSKCNQEAHGGNIMSLSREIVSFKEGTMVLDIGYGSGSWLMEMNKEFPDAKYIGVDISGTIPEDRASSIIYEFGDIVKGLKYPDASFDFINMRHLVYGLSIDEWYIALKEIRRLLKPKGCAQLTEIQHIPRNPENRSDYDNAIFDYITEMGQDPMITYNLSKYTHSSGMRIIHNEQRNLFFGQNNHLMNLYKRFCEISHEIVLLKIGPRIGVPVSEYKSYAKQYIKHQVEKDEENVWCSYLICYK